MNENIHKNNFKESSLTSFLWESRPQCLKTNIDNTFSQYSGDPLPQFSMENYNLCNTDDIKLITQVLSQHIVQTTYNILDIGGGDYSWINNVVELVNKDFSSAITLNIYGINAESYSHTITKGNANIHYFGGFKSEDIINELAKKDYDFNYKFDLVVSHWTLRYLVDPLGTVLQAYELLKPEGLMLFNGFSTKLINSDDSLIAEADRGSDNYEALLHLVQYLDAEHLFCTHSQGFDVILKKNTGFYNLPINYDGECKKYLASFKFMEYVAKQDFNLDESCIYGSSNLFNFFADNNLMYNSPEYCGQI